jgi:hypothetical protein
MQGIDGTIEFESQEELEEWFEWCKGFTMTEEDVEQGLQGADADRIKFPVEMDITLTKQTVKKLAQKDAQKTVQLKQRVEGDKG